MSSKTDPLPAGPHSSPNPEAAVASRRDDYIRSHSLSRPRLSPMAIPFSPKVGSNTKLPVDEDVASPSYSNTPSPQPDDQAEDQIYQYTPYSKIRMMAPGTVKDSTMSPSPASSSVSPAPVNTAGTEAAFDGDAEMGSCSALRSQSLRSSSIVSYSSVQQLLVVSKGSFPSDKEMTCPSLLPSPSALSPADVRTLMKIIDFGSSSSASPSLGFSERDNSIKLAVSDDGSSDTGLEDEVPLNHGQYDIGDELSDGYVDENQSMESSDGEDLAKIDGEISGDDEGRTTDNENSSGEVAHALLLKDLNAPDVETGPAREGMTASWGSADLEMASRVQVVSQKSRASIVTVEKNQNVKELEVSEYDSFRSLRGDTRTIAVYDGEMVRSDFKVSHKSRASLKRISAML